LSTKHPNILIVEPDDTMRQQLQEVLRSAGYEVSSASSQEEGFRVVQSGTVDVFLLSADLADVLCCSSLAEIKGLGSTANTRVILFANGGGAVRARALDLGADDVITPPWEPSELLARVRVQLRDKHALEELQQKSRIAEEGQEIAHTAFQAIAVTEKMTRDAFSIGRALKIGVSALLAVAALISIIFLLFTRRADKVTRRAYSVIAQLEHGVRTEEALVTEANKAREELLQSDITEQKRQLQKQSDDLRQRLSAADASEVSGLRNPTPPKVSFEPTLPVSACSTFRFPSWTGAHAARCATVRSIPTASRSKTATETWSIAWRAALPRLRKTSSAPVSSSAKMKSSPTTMSRNRGGRMKS
jgi:DNA-binding response OmpR family regulator